MKPKNEWTPKDYAAQIPHQEFEEMPKAGKGKYFGPKKGQKMADILKEMEEHDRYR